MQRNSAEGDRFSSMTDEQLVALCHDGEDLIPVIVSRYAYVVKSKASSMRVDFTEREDMMQEGFLGLISAVRAFNPEKNVSFSTYANRCIFNKMVSALPKRENEVFDEQSDDEPDNNTPESIFFSKLLSEEVSRIMKENFSDKERKVFKLFLKGESYENIAKTMGVSPKAVDNALQRVRKKLRLAFHSGNL